MTNIGLKKLIKFSFKYFPDPKIIAPISAPIPALVVIIDKPVLLPDSKIPSYCGLYF